jgi:hypothetical protein
MNNEINFLYDEYKTNRLVLNAFNDRHYYSPEFGCFIYRTCWFCENKIINKLITGMITCKYNIKPDQDKRCEKYIEDLKVLNYE